MERILDIMSRTPRPRPWAEGENIPWNDPDFSARMLKEHLTQAHGAASRRFERIDAHVQWIQATVLAGAPSRILDLGCGPGLYTTRLAKLGHRCTGIDYAPASIAYAETQAADDPALTYLEGDIRHTDYGEDFDLVMLIFGELNVFSPADAEGILRKAHAALRPGGRIVLEPNTASAVEHQGRQRRSWYSSGGGLFSDRPHLVLHEHFWDPETRTSSTRYFIIDAETHAVTRHAATAQAYDDDELRSLLERAGFDEIESFGGLSGQVEAADPSGMLSAWVARKP